ncbi:3-keto-5-aminohexanoate cleavage protein [Umezawaea sp.]|uniref:3-keto-5-aminohexanoate cleavage protein n=1 Tax=Umezawaea sp. TaxID=1955258 RepID=UPI002ED68D72
MARTGSPGTMLTVVPRWTESTDVLVGAAQNSERVGVSVVRLPLAEPGRLAETVAGVRERTDLLVQLADVTDERALDARPDCASCPLAGAESEDGWAALVRLHAALRDRGVAAEYEITRIEQVSALRRLLDDHGLPLGDRVHVGLVLGAPGGSPGDAATLVDAVRLLPEGATFSAAGLGGSTIPVMLTALATGGHLRVGTADTADYADGQAARDDVQLVARAAGLAKIAQRPPLPVAGARELLGAHSPVQV